MLVIIRVWVLLESPLSSGGVIPIFLHLLTHDFNMSLTSQSLPSLWKWTVSVFFKLAILLL